MEFNKEEEIAKIVKKLRDDHIRMWTLELQRAYFANINRVFGETLDDYIARGIDDREKWLISHDAIEKQQEEQLSWALT
jgi:hypothetical protein